MEEVKLFILGLIQGLAEFFPISSSGHVTIYDELFSISENEQESRMLLIIVHAATALSTMVFYRSKIQEIIKGLLLSRSKQSALFVLKLIVSTFPIILVYCVLYGPVKEILNNTILACFMFVLTGFILILSSLKTKTNNDINFFHAFLMGVAQAIAVLPGMSRSGSTISMALFCNIDKKKATDFSFLMALAPIIGAAIVTFLELLSGENTDSINYTGYIVAFFAAFFAGLFACKYMIKIVQNNNLKYFGYYCILIGVGFLVYFLS
tara:strand:+ start:1737 stop:2531 length:795 start_codon:yes stop_codon:yes gene_type:complete